MTDERVAVGKSPSRWIGLSPTERFGFRGPSDLLWRGAGGTRPASALISSMPTITKFPFRRWAKCEKPWRTCQWASTWPSSLARTDAPPAEAAFPPANRGDAASSACSPLRRLSSGSISVYRNALAGAAWLPAGVDCAALGRRRPAHRCWQLVPGLLGANGPSVVSAQRRSAARHAPVARFRCSSSIDRSAQRALPDSGYGSARRRTSSADTTLPSSSGSISHRSAKASTNMRPRPEEAIPVAFPGVGTAELVSRTAMRMVSRTMDNETVKSERACRMAFVASSETTCAASSQR